VNGIKARVCWIESLVLALTYTIEGDINHIWIPPSRLPRRANHLWQHTCFEAFLSAPAKPEYWEFNLSPSGEWAVYGFSGYRERVPREDAEFVQEITACRIDGVLELHATICLSRLPLMQCAHLRLGLAAVIEDENGALSYWALKHAPGQADFHHASSFVMEIAWPETGMAKL
jgi:hypothetical protein